jgi:hypothetical protein
VAFVYDGTWNGQNAKKITTQGAMERITRMVTASLLSCRAVQRDDAARARYVTHFNDAGLLQLPTVTRILQTLERRVARPGEDVVLSLLMAPPPGLALPPGATWNDCEACAVPGNPPPNQPVTVYVCPAFFRGDVYVPRNDPRQRSGTGTVLHELTHACANTADHGYSWQPHYGVMAAAQRATNADTYREYCQEFDVLRV